MQNISKSKIKFKQEIYNVYHLFDLYNELKDLELLDIKKQHLLKSMHITITAYWQTYIQDICEESFNFLLKISKTKKWIQTLLENNKKSKIKKFNTPRSSEIDSLFTETIGLEKLSSCWYCNKFTNQQTKAQLGNYIETRGQLAHTNETNNEITKKKYL